MPKTPPLILPNNFPSWFNTDGSEKSPFGKSTEELQRILDDDSISNFTFTPSEDEEGDQHSDLNNKKSRFSQGSVHQSQRSNNKGRDADMDDLYHKPTSNQGSQQQKRTSHNNTPLAVVNENNSQQYQLEDDDDMLESQQNGQQTQQSQQQFPDQNNEDGITDTQAAMEDNSFFVAIDELTQEYQSYAEEYREFKRHVDSAKRELLDYINQKTPYFEERGSYLSQKWESLKEYI